MTEAGQSGQHVLVIDDEAQIRQFVRAGMELGGYRVSEAANGRDALREMTLHPVNLVILDLALPDIDGSEFLERIRAWSSVPVIILSVRAGETEKVKLLAGCADVRYLQHESELYFRRGPPTLFRVSQQWLVRFLKHRIADRRMNGFRRACWKTECSRSVTRALGKVR
jgi:CheY-like chemotaxis protein